MMWPYHIFILLSPLANLKKKTKKTAPYYNFTQVQIDHIDTFFCCCCFIDWFYKFWCRFKIVAIFVALERLRILMIASSNSWDY